MGAGLFAFVFGVFYYTVSQMKAVGSLGPEFDEKLDTKKETKTTTTVVKKA